MLVFPVGFCYNQIIPKTGGKCRDLFGKWVGTITISDDYLQDGLNKYTESIDCLHYLEFVYYVEGNRIYLGYGWDSELHPDTFTLEGDKLYLPIEDAGDTEFTRIIE